MQGVARRCKESPENEHVKSQGPVLERGDLTIPLQPITAQNNLYVTALLRPGTVLSTPHKYPKMADFWSEEREEILIRLLEDQPVLYDVASKGYSNRDSKRRACCEIAVAIGVSGKEAILCFSFLLLFPFLVSCFYFRFIKA